MTNRIRAVMQQRQLEAADPGYYTVAAIAARLGVHEQTVWKWRSGERLPSARRLLDLAADLGVPVEELLFSDPAPVSASA